MEQFWWDNRYINSFLCRCSVLAMPGFGFVIDKKKNYLRSLKQLLLLLLLLPSLWFVILSGGGSVQAEVVSVDAVVVVVPFELVLDVDSVVIGFPLVIVEELLALVVGDFGVDDVTSNKQEKKFNYLF